MVLPAINYTLTVSVDGNKRTNDPTGVWTPAYTTPTPTNFRTTSKTYTTITLAWDIVDPFDSDRIEINMATGSGSTNWGPAPVPILGIASVSVVQSPLTQSTTYRFRIRTTHIASGQTSVWSPIIEISTDALPTSGDTDLQSIFYYENFQTGVNGQVVSGFTSFENAANTSSTDAIAYPNGGTRCIETWCPSGVNGEGSWGAANTSDTPHLSSSGEMWVRMGLAFPGGYPFDSNQGHIPLYIISCAALPNTTESGYIILSIDSVTRQLLISTTWDATLQRFNATINFDVWQMVELYVLLSENNSAGKVKVWVDSSPVTAVAGGYTLTLQTLPNASSYVYTTYWHGSWPAPGGYGTGQKSYGDEFAIAGKGTVYEGGVYIDNTSVMDTDTNGANYIGKVVTYVAPPVDPGPGPGLGVTDLDKMYYFENFSGLSAGDRIDTYTDLQACDYARCVTDNVYPGTTHAASTYLLCSDITFNANGDQDQGGYGEWGFVHSTGFPKMTNDGSELWYRLALYYPSGHSWATTRGSGSVKHFRINKVAGSLGTGSSEGYMDTYQDGNEIFAATEYRDKTDGNPSGNVYSNVNLPTGRWVMYECYYKLNPGHNGRRKVWLDGTLILDYNLGLHSNPTFSTSRSLFCTYHNGLPARCPGQNQATHYFGQYTLAVKGNIIGVGYRDNTGDMDRDELNEPFIGMAAK